MGGHKDNDRGKKREVAGQTSVEIGSITDISADSQGRVKAHVGQ